MGKKSPTDETASKKTNRVFEWLLSIRLTQVRCSEDLKYGQVCIFNDNRVWFANGPDFEWDL